MRASLLRGQIASVIAFGEEMSSRLKAWPLANDDTSRRVLTLKIDIPGFVLTPLVEKQIPEQAEELGISEDQVVKEVLWPRRSTSNSPPWRTSLCSWPRSRPMR
jgi:hypothetical protein